ncbi:MAG TPA: hypothetical protein VI893_09110, partial [Thermoplasmata archaeon]|nr:hypothetical protein [Thermoplasmata archaeon]
MTLAGGGIILVATVGLFKSKDKPAAAGPGPKNCPTCGKPAEWVAQYSKHYCRNCSKYLEADPPKEAAKPAEPRPAVAKSAAETPAKPVAKKLGPPCPTCGKTSEWVAQYSRHYCRNCSKYLDDVPAKPAAPTALATKTPEPVAMEVGPSTLPENEVAERSEGPAVPPGMGVSPATDAEPKPTFDPYKPMVIRMDTAGTAVKEEPALKAPEDPVAAIPSTPSPAPAAPSMTVTPAPVAPVPAPAPA